VIVRCSIDSGANCPVDLSGICKGGLGKVQANSFSLLLKDKAPYRGRMVKAGCCPPPTGAGICVSQSKSTPQYPNHREQAQGLAPLP